MLLLSTDCKGVVSYSVTGQLLSLLYRSWKRPQGSAKYSLGTNTSRSSLEGKRIVSVTMFLMVEFIFRMSSFQLI